MEGQYKFKHAIRSLEIQIQGSYRNHKRIYKQEENFPEEYFKKQDERYKELEALKNMK